MTERDESVEDGRLITRAEAKRDRVKRYMASMTGDGGRGESIRETGKM